MLHPAGGSTATTDIAALCAVPARSSPMYQSQHLDLARLQIEQRIRPRRVEGIRRSARLISLEIRRSRRPGHGS